MNCFIGSRLGNLKEFLHNVFDHLSFESHALQGFEEDFIDFNDHVNAKEVAQDVARTCCLQQLKVADNFTA